MSIAFPAPCSIGFITAFSTGFITAFSTGFTTLFLNWFSKFLNCLVKCSVVLFFVFLKISSKCIIITSNFLDRDLILSMIALESFDMSVLSLKFFILLYIDLVLFNIISGSIKSYVLLFLL
jgi:hypothetical protein